MYQENQELFHQEISGFDFQDLYSPDLMTAASAHAKLSDLRLIAGCSPECEAIFYKCLAASYGKIGE